MARIAAFALALGALGATAAGQSFTNYETGPTAPLRLSPNGQRLFVADTVGSQLSVFSLATPSEPQLLAEIPVGLEPVSVNPRTENEVWVCCQLSDSVDIVDVASGVVTTSLRVGDEPSDVVFAGLNAFVTTATLNEIQVIDIATRVHVASIPIFGKDPRALAVSPNGTKVYALVQRSGNGTTIVSHGDAPGPLESSAGVLDPYLVANPPDPANLTPPQVSRIVRFDDPLYTSANGGPINYQLPDHDIAEIDVASLTVTRYFTGVGTTNTGIAVDPTTGDLWVANTDARNLIRFEPVLRGHAIDSRVTHVATGATPVVTPHDLNPTINYSVLPNTAAQAIALAEPFGVAIDAANSRLYVAAHGTDRIGILDLNGNVLDRIDLGGSGNTRDKRGPRGLALAPGGAHLYVLNHLSDTLAVIETATKALMNEQGIATVDPMPLALREGRNFLYDARLSGNASFSCAACHIDGDTDGIAWDLGDPQGSAVIAPFYRHPMKGPMTTQTLRGLSGTGPLHWRGDKADFQSFNSAFDKLMGGQILSAGDLQDFADFGTTIAFPPNPNQRLDRSLSVTNGPLNPPRLGSTNNEAQGAFNFSNALVGLNCVTCHALPTGTGGSIQSANQSQSTQPFKVAHLRNLYRKEVASNASGDRDSGFGLGHDGAFDRIFTSMGSNPPHPSPRGFLMRPVFTSVPGQWDVTMHDDTESFLRSFDTGTAPLVGARFVMDQAQATSVAAEVGSWLGAVGPNDFEMTAYGRWFDRLTGFLFDPSTQTFVTDRTGVGPFTLAQLEADALLGNAHLTFMAVPPGSGSRIVIDRDEDGDLNGEEDADPYGIGMPGCGGANTLSANSVPFVGNSQFSYLLGNAQASTLGVLVIGNAAASLPALGLNLLVDPTTAASITVYFDGTGSTQFALPIPNDPLLAGSQFYGQVLTLDTCGPSGWSSSAGLEFAIQP